MGIILPMYIKKTIFTTQYAALNILKLNTSVFSLLFCSSLCDLTIRSQAKRDKSLLQEYIIHESCSGSHPLSSVYKWEKFCFKPKILDGNQADKSYPTIRNLITTCCIIISIRCIFNIYWCTDQYTVGQVVSWGERCRIKHLPTRLYLAIVKEENGYTVCSNL